MLTIGKEKGRILKPVSEALDSNARVVRSDNAVGESLEDDFLVLDLGGGEYFGIGEVGGFIWSRLDGSRTLTELASEISQEFEVSVNRAQDDLSRFVHDLMQRNLARLEDDGAGSAPDLWR